MNHGSTIFAQLIAHGSRDALARCIRRYRGNYRVKKFCCRDQFLVMAFAQLTYRESLRGIEACLGTIPDRLYHMAGVASGRAEVFPYWERYSLDSRQRRLLPFW